MRLGGAFWKLRAWSGGAGSRGAQHGEFLPWGVVVGALVAAQPVKEVFYLVAPELTLVFDLPFGACKIFDDEDSLVGHFGFLDAEFEKLLGGSFHPMKTNKFFEFTFGYFRFIGCPIPGKTEHIIPFVYFICKPLLQSCRRA